MGQPSYMKRRTAGHDRGVAPGQHLSDDLHFAFVILPVLGARKSRQFLRTDKNAHLPCPSTVAPVAT
jgi:hypothetical protein